jgi:hypothetical protein
MQFAPLTPVTKYSTYTNISDSALIKTGSGLLQAIVINSHSGGQIKIWDNTSAATTVMFNTTVLSTIGTTGERFIPYFGAKFTTGLYVQVVAGTVDLTVLYNY